MQGGTKMKFKLIGSNNCDNVKETFLQNRGIKDIEQYCHLTESCVNDYNDLANIADAVKMFLSNMDTGKKMGILVDCDCDGYTSAATLYNYTKLNYPDIDIKYYLHSSKQHGLSADVFNTIINDDIEFLCIPDAGTNDTEQCKQLRDKDIDVLILDHHNQDVDNPYAVIVNNQCSPCYQNKELSGVGIVWQFLRAVDDEIWNDSADNYLDLVAIGNIADVMDMRSFETRYLVDKGLQQIVNPCLEAFVDGQGFQIKGRMNIHAVEWNISPLINAVCRVGTMEDKEILFKALIGDEGETYMARKKDKETGKFVAIEENVYEHAFRLAKNAKTRQDNSVKKLIPEVREWISKHGTDKFPVLFARLPDETDGSFTGLIANRIANEYRKPTVILRKTDGKLGGSGRNFDNSPLPSLKEILDKSDKFDLVQGHDNAFGVNIDSEQVKSAIAYCARACKDIDFAMKSVDFTMDYDELDIKFIRDIDGLKDLYGAGLKEPLVYISNIHLQADQGALIGKSGNTWKFTDDDEITFIKFLASNDDPVLNFLEDGEDNEIVISAICKVGFNEFNGVLTAQVQVIDYEVM